MDTGEVDPEILEKLGYMARIWLLIDFSFKVILHKFRHIFYIYFRFYKVKAIKKFKNILRINLKTKIDDKEVQWIFIERADDEIMACSTNLGGEEGIK